MASAGWPAGSTEGRKEAALDEIEPDDHEITPVHRAVMPSEVLHWLEPKAGGIYLDGTAGAGGHSCLIAEQVGPTGRVIGLDRDAAMLALARNTASEHGVALDLHQSSYADAGAVLARLGIDHVDGFLVDLGLSSDQLAWGDRGFSFQGDGPLDMRFDISGDRPTAAEIVNEWTETELADIFWKYGEERHSRRLARAVAERRRTDLFETTADFAAVIRRAMPGPRGKIDPCTRVFQALRIAVNDELGELERLLEQVHEWVKPDGRFVVISFHSLEDRMAKHALREHPAWEVLTKKVVIAADSEQAENPRSRSAKLRAARRRPEPEQSGERNS